MASDATPGPVSDFDRTVYREIANHCLDEAVCWPSQQRIARHLDCARESVNRSVRRLVAAGWLEIVERRRAPGARWRHNVYALHAPFVVAYGAAKRITRGAFWRRFWRPGHMNEVRKGSNDNRSRPSQPPETTFRRVWRPKVRLQT